MVCPELSTYFDSEAVAAVSERIIRSDDGAATPQGDVYPTLHGVVEVAGAMWQFGLAMQSFLLGNYSGALDEYSRLSAIFAESRVWTQESCCWIQMAIANQRLNRLTEAIRCGQVAVDRASRAGNRCLLASAHNNLALALRLASEPKLAFQHRQAALGIYKELGDTRGVALSIAGIGTLQADAFQTEVALKTYLEALQMFRSIAAFEDVVNTLKNIQVLRKQQDGNHGWDESKCVPELRSARQAGKSGDWLKAETMARLALVHYRKHEEVDGEAQTLSVLSIIAANSEQYEEALEYIKKASQIGRTRKDLNSLHTFLFNHQSLLANGGLMDQRLPALQELLQVCFELGDISHVTDVLERLAETHKWLGNAAEAAKYAHELAGLYRASGLAIRLARTLDTLAGCQIELNQLDKARQNAKAALGIFESAGQECDAAIAESLLGLISIRLGNWDSAHTHLSKALLTSRTCEDTANVAACLEGLGIVHINTGKEDLARQAFLEALSCCEEIGDARRATVLRDRLLWLLGPNEDGQFPFVSEESLRTVEPPYAQLHQAFQHLQEGSATAALEVLTNLIESREDAEPHSNLMVWAHILRVQAWCLLDDLHSATRDLSKVLTKLDIVNVHITEPNLKQTFWEQPLVTLIYTNLVRLLSFFDGQEQQMFDLVERVRSRTLRELLGDSLLHVPNPFKAQTLAPDSNISRLMFHFSTRSRLKEPDLEPEERQMLEQWLSEGETDYKNAIAALADTHPKYAALKRGEAMSFAELKEILVN